MSRLPAALLYLTIYNPTLLPPNPEDIKDEDSEEQAHILFYTASERAASRDRMLRQVGLAKALVNFSQMFSLDDVCENVHSQSRRMIMVSPEPDFWIHGCFELAKTERPVVGKGKEKSKSKKKEPNVKRESDLVYDWHDSSIHDNMLRSRILQGYEQFKLTHGSFTSILSTLGQEALELQLERFFTVWAWSLDIDNGNIFGTQLGIPLHPAYRELVPALDAFASQRVEDLVMFVLTPPYLIPSSRFMESKFSSSLFTHIMSRIPPPPSPSLASHKSSKSLSASASPPQKSATDAPKGAPVEESRAGPGSSSGSPFMGMSMPSINLHMDMRNFKLTWPGYLNLGRQSLSQSPKPSSVANIPSSAPHPAHGRDTEPTNVTEGNTDNTTIAASVDQGSQHPGVVEVDSESLLEAMTTESLRPTPPRSASPSAEAEIPHSVDTSRRAEDQGPPDVPGVKSEEDATRLIHDANGRSNIQDNPVDLLIPQTSIPAADDSSPSLLATEEKVNPLSPSFQDISVFLSEPHEPLITRRMRVSHLTRSTLTFAVMASEDEFLTLDMALFAAQVEALLTKLQSLISDEESKRGADTPVPSATKILQPQDKYIISLGESMTYSTSTFDSKSEQLSYSQNLLHSEPELLEVFSRGQNPQHWHIAKRGQGGESLAEDAEVYMEVARKESSLADVDNDLAGVIRRYLQ